MCHSRRLRDHRVQCHPPVCRGPLKTPGGVPDRPKGPISGQQVVVVGVVSLVSRLLRLPGGERGQAPHGRRGGPVSPGCQLRALEPVGHHPRRTIGQDEVAGGRQTHHRRLRGRGANASTQSVEASARQVSEPDEVDDRGHGEAASVVEDAGGSQPAGSGERRTNRLS